MRRRVKVVASYSTDETLGLEGERTFRLNTSLPCNWRRNEGGPRKVSCWIPVKLIILPPCPLWPAPVGLSALQRHRWSNLTDRQTAFLTRLKIKVLLIKDTACLGRWVCLLLDWLFPCQVNIFSFTSKTFSHLTNFPILFPWGTFLASHDGTTTEIRDNIMISMSNSHRQSFFHESIWNQYIQWSSSFSAKTAACCMWKKLLEGVRLNWNSKIGGCEQKQQVQKCNKVTQGWY